MWQYNWQRQTERVIGLAGDAIIASAVASIYAK